MSPDPESAPLSLTRLIDAWRNGQDEALGHIFELAYGELRQLAAQRMRHQGRDLTLSPTELLHDVLLRVIGTAPQWQNRTHFLASMSLYMRAVLVDHARARHSERRGGGLLRVTLGQVDIGDESVMTELLALDEALNRLEQHDPRCSAVLHLTYFAGMDRHRIAEVLAVSVQIVDRELRFARSWLNAHIGSAL